MIPTRSAREADLHIDNSALSLSVRGGIWVDTFDSKSNAARREGSSPSVPTMGMHVTKDGELDLQSGCEGFDSLRLHYIGLSASLVCHGTVNALEIAGSSPAFPANFSL